MANFPQHMDHTLARRLPSKVDLPRVRYVREPVPLHFPVQAEVPEGFNHLLVRTFLFELLRFVLGDEHCVGSDQFIYWNARNPRRCLSPDVYVRFNQPQDCDIRSWKTWERGTPELAVEFISPNEDDGIEWEEKVARYHELGIQELVRFDPLEPEGKQLRVWDRVKGDLVERAIEGDTTPCAMLQLTWVVRALR